MFQSVWSILRREARAIRHVWSAGPDWMLIFSFLVVHVSAVGSLFFLSIEGTIALLVLGVLTGLGVTVGLHRYFTHESFETSRWMQGLLALFGQLAGQGTVLHWVAIHRKHHHLVDGEEDPHSPRHRGFLWAHFLWFMVRLTLQELDELYEKYVPRLRGDPLIQFLHRFGALFHMGLGLLLLGIGYALGGWYTGLSMMLMGIFLRAMIMLHVTWSVNSIGHLLGYRNHPADDDSRNFLPLAPFSFGEHLHAGHHDHPYLAHFAHRWFEYLFDTGYWIICVLERLGLAWNVRRRTRTTAVL